MHRKGFNSVPSGHKAARQTAVALGGERAQPAPFRNNQRTHGSASFITWGTGFGTVGIGAAGTCRANITGEHRPRLTRAATHHQLFQQHDAVRMGHIAHKHVLTVNRPKVLGPRSLPIHTVTIDHEHIFFGAGRHINAFITSFVRHLVGFARRTTRGTQFAIGPSWTWQALRGASFGGVGSVGTGRALLISEAGADKIDTLKHSKVTTLFEPPVLGIRPAKAVITFLDGEFQGCPS
eukprot:Lithocolla_globosa_v1_NODE_1318_length_2675_cov_7.927481.p3 type:complete len:236 gc:universal NODE_1318_length_2675_cov_7.927481:1370-2077(+)